MVNLDRIKGFIDGGGLEVLKAVHEKTSREVKLSMGLKFFKCKQEKIPIDQIPQVMRETFRDQSMPTVAAISYHLAANNVDMLEYCLSLVDPRIHEEVSTKYVNAWIDGKDLIQASKDIAEEYADHPASNDVLAVLTWYMFRSGINNNDK